MDDPSIFNVLIKYLVYKKVVNHIKTFVGVGAIFRFDFFINLLDAY